MKALSIRQPWAWLIIKGHKDIENRSWPTAFRGRVLVHAAKGMTTSEYVDADFFVCGGGIKLPRPRDLFRGGIIGMVDVVDCVTKSDSPWFFGKYGFVLQNPTPLPFLELRGQLGFFDVAEDVHRLR